MDRGLFPFANLPNLDRSIGGSNRGAVLFLMQQITPALIEQARAKIKYWLSRGDCERANTYAGIVTLYRVGLGEIQVKLKHPAKALRKI